MLFNARCLCTFYSFLPIGMGAIGRKFTAVYAFKLVCANQAFCKLALSSLRARLTESSKRETFDVGNIH